MEFIITPIDWILIAVGVINLALVLSLFSKVKNLSTGTGTGDCCDQLEKWAKKQDLWIETTVLQLGKDRELMKQVKTAVCVHHDYLVAKKREAEGETGVIIPDLGVLGFCGTGTDPVGPPPPPCDWGTCME